MLCRSATNLLKSAIKYSTFAQKTATLRLPPNRAKQVFCDVEGAPCVSVMIDKQVGCELVGRDLGRQPVKIDIIFYDGCHFARDNLPESPRLTLTSEVASLLNIQNGAEVPAALYHGGVTDGSAITLKGTEGEEMWDYTLHGTRVFRKALENMK